MYIRVRTECMYPQDDRGVYVGVCAYRRRLILSVAPYLAGAQTRRTVPTRRRRRRSVSYTSFGCFETPPRTYIMSIILYCYL